jgi:SagB-type dehydrogenase family enzyme
VSTTVDTTARSIDPTVTYVRARHLCLRWRDGALACFCGVNGREFMTTAEAVRVLDLAGRASPAFELAARSGVPGSYVDALVEAGLLVPAPEVPETATGWLDHWGTYELAVQRLTARGCMRAGYDETPMPPPLRRHPGEVIPLPTGGVVADERPDEASFAAVLARRRSSRASFADAALSLNELGDLLIGAAAVRRMDEARGLSYRPSPSGGARHPLELYVVPVRVEGLDGLAHHFQPVDRSLVRLADTGRLSGWVRRGAERLPSEPGHGDFPPAAVILIIASFARTLWKYENIGLAAVYKDTGALLQTLYLQATAMGLAGYAVGGGPESAISAGLGLDPVMDGYVGSFLIGRSRSNDD